MQDGFYKSFTADVAFTGRELAAFGGADYHAVPAAGPNVPLIGVADSLAVPQGWQVDVQQTQWGEAIAGGTITRGDKLMADASGHAVTAVKQAGATVYTAGIAQISAVAGDVFPFLIVLDRIDG